VPEEAIALLLIWLYLNGRWWPSSTSAARHDLLRARLVPARVFAWAAVAGGLALASLVGLWIVLTRLTGAGGNPTLPNAGAYPPLVVAVAIVMGSRVSPLTQEAAFRGYGQVLLERSFKPGSAVVLSSLLFTLYHGPTQGFAPSKILFYFVVGVVFGVAAFITQSVLPAIPVHIAGDLLFFTLVWPQDASRPLVWTSGADLNFWLEAAEMVGFWSPRYCCIPSFVAGQTVQEHVRSVRFRGFQGSSHATLHFASGDCGSSSNFDASTYLTGSPRTSEVIVLPFLMD
jgi:membrane protease YdiL (CAAX protease family)